MTDNASVLRCLTNVIAEFVRAGMAPPAEIVLKDATEGFRLLHELEIETRGNSRPNARNPTPRQVFHRRDGGYLEIEIMGVAVQWPVGERRR